MADEPTLTAAQLRALAATRKPTTNSTPAPSITSAPSPGFRFGKGARVIDLVTGGRGAVLEAYQSASGQGPVYELRQDVGYVIVRLERDLEPDGAQNIPNTLPRI